MKRIGMFIIAALAAIPVLAQQPDPARSLFNTGRDFFDDGKYADAEKTFRDVLTKFPKSDQADKADYYLITTLVKLGRAREALDEIAAFQKNYPSSKWMTDVQEKRISLTNEVPANLVDALATPFGPIVFPPAPPVPPRIQSPFGRITVGDNGDSEVSLQQEILRVLLQNNPDRGIDVAAERLKADPADPVVISNLSMIAISASDKAFPMLVTIAKTSPSPKARRDATFWIGRGRGDKDAIVTTLLEILSSTDDADMQRAVASALSEVGTPRSSNALTEMARDRNRSVTGRRAALELLARNGGPNALPVLEELYKSASDSVDLRRSVTTLISRIQDPRSIPVLTNIAKTDADLAIRRTAIQALGRRKEPEAIKALEDLLKDAPPIPRAQLEDNGSFDSNLDFDFNLDLDSIRPTLEDLRERLRELHQ